MRRHHLVFPAGLSLLLLSFLAATGCVRRTADAAPPRLAASLPPASLEGLYPPKARRPELLLRMLELARSFVEVATAVERGEEDQARTAFGKLSETYRGIAAVVPEWSHYMKADALAELQAAIGRRAEEFPASLAAFDEAACSPCHVAERRNVWFVFSWPARYADLVVTDPLVEKELSYREFMFRLAFGQEQVGLHLAAGRRKEAVTALSDLRARLGNLLGACVACHPQPRRSVLTGDVLARLEKLGDEIEAGKVENLGPVMQALGTGTCYACHRIHSPAADVQRQWAAAHDASDGR